MVKANTKNAVPDRWEEYCVFRNAIEGTRFLPFKVPLKARINSKVEENLMFSPDQFFERLENEKLTMGVIVDLTNTSRYYEPEDIEKHEVEYQKIMTQGHIVPSSRVCADFKFIVDEFLEENKHNDKLIGVHCTHGVNRTGYLICRYMIETMGIEPEESIRRFNAARGHDIERETYLDNLKQKAWEFDPRCKLPAMPPRRSNVGPSRLMDYPGQDMYNRNNAPGLRPDFGPPIEPHYVPPSRFNGSFVPYDIRDRPARGRGGSFHRDQPWGASGFHGDRSENGWRSGPPGMGRDRDRGYEERGRQFPNVGNFYDDGGYEYFDDTRARNHHGSSVRTSEPQFGNHREQWSRHEVRKSRSDRRGNWS